MIIARLIGHTQFTLRQLVEILSATYLFFFSFNSYRPGNKTVTKLRVSHI